MSYKELPFEERMQKAMEYALLLVADDRPGLDIINELKDIFGFTENEARDCYTRMRKKFDDQFDAAIKTKIRFAWTGLVMSTLILVFFAFLGVGIGWLYLLYTFIWGTALIGIVPFLAKHYREKAMSPESGYLFDRERDQRIKLDNRGNDWTTGVPLVLFIFTIITFYLFYSKSDILDTNDLFGKYNMVIDDRVRLINTGNKVSHYVMIFRFKGFANKFKFDEDYYNYGKREITTGSFLIGDTLAIEMKRSDIVDLEEGSGENLKITNIAINDDWLIDHEYRNKMVAQKNKRYFIWSIVGFVAGLILVFIWIRFRKAPTE